MGQLRRIFLHVHVQSKTLGMFKFDDAEAGDGENNETDRRSRKRHLSSTFNPDGNKIGLIENERATKKGKCDRTVFIPSEEQSYFNLPQFIFYLMATKIFYQNADKTSNDPKLPRKRIIRHWDSLDSIVHINNQDLERNYERQKQIFENEGKVDKYGNVPELLLFHGTTNENINKIVDDNFNIDILPMNRGKLMLFGKGVYFSELPGVSLMYGESLILCKVLLGKCQKYYPNGLTPPEIPDEFDSRVIIRDGLEVVTVIKKASQILPFCIVNIKKGRIVQIGSMVNSNVKKEELGKETEQDKPKTSLINRKKWNKKLNYDKL